MGMVVHNAIIVIAWDVERIKAAYEKARSIKEHSDYEEKDYAPLKRLTTKPIKCTANGYLSFAILPDGSKVGWELAQDAESAREKFLDWLSARKRANYYEWVQVAFGADTNGPVATRYSRREDDL